MFHAYSNVMELAFNPPNCVTISPIAKITLTKKIAVIKYLKDHKIICSDDKIPCSDNSLCYSTNQRCDHFYDCKDHSDELYCPRF